MNKTRTKLAADLRSLGKDISKKSIYELYPEDLDVRNLNNSLLCFAYSKQRISQQPLEFLLKIPDEFNLRDSLNQLFEGEIQNL